MKKSEILYFELKTGFNDNGPAWIGRSVLSKSGSTIYSNGKAFSKYRGRFSNHIDIETGEEYWISGVKKNQEDRHWAGSGKIMIDSDCIDEYLALVNKKELDKKLFEIVTLKPSGASNTFHQIENEKQIVDFDDQLRFKELYQLSNDELRQLIEHYIESEKTAKYNKGRRYVKQVRIKAAEELERRESQNAL